ncbi:GGDEF domain-containing protein [Halochromatium salexigens]|uniref:GGDEF domain-containing protein n=1 Tax=Halochromatium salexigens TaxID=49447 RepID=UPI0019126FDF|nr:GGDEF domain-containing protein [Halochromatium salexigens]
MSLLAGRELSNRQADERLGEHLVALLVESLQIDCAAVLTQTNVDPPGADTLVVAHALGLDMTFQVTLSVPLSEQPLNMVTEQVPPEARAALRGQGLRHWLWTASPRSGIVLLLGQRREQVQGLPLCFEEDDLAIAEAGLCFFEATRLSVTDHLTELVNRTRLDQVMEENLMRSRRYATPFSVIMVDMDHFKLVNDQHGHQVGDEVLVCLAKVLMNNTRAVDVVGRWGGEEFMVVAPSTDLAQAVHLAEKLRMAIANSELPAVGFKTASIGVASYHAGDDRESMIGRSDAALYKAKRNGRNQVWY